MKQAFTRFSHLIFILALFAVSTISAQAQAVFVENKGQWPDHVTHQVRLNGGAAFLQEDGFKFVIYHEDDLAQYTGHQHAHSDHTNEEISDEIRTHAWNLRFLNTASYGYVEGQNQYSGEQNYLIGNDPQKWGKGAARYGALTWKSLYSGIDMEIGESQDGHLKWDFRIAPYGNPGDIRFSYDHVEVKNEGQRLVIQTSVGTFYESIPLAYQEIKGKRIPVACEYIITEQGIGFTFPNGYSRKHSIVIDPVLSFATYSGSTADNFGFTATYDVEGHLFGGGIVFNTGYPVTNGAYSSTYSGLIDLGITKFTIDGTGLLYSTYIGGSDGETPNSMVVNDQGHLYVFGITGSLNFPVGSSPYQGTHQGGLSDNFPSNGTNFTNGTDIYVVALDSAGSNLIGGTYLGGSANDGLNTGSHPGINTLLAYNYGDLFRGEVIVDDNSNVFIASCTQSSNFPTTPGAYQMSSGGAQDAIVASFNPDLSNLLWSTYLGGSQADAAYSLKLDNRGDVLVTGGTLSINFPATGGAYQPVPAGQMDGFLTKIEAGGSIVPSSTFVGTSSPDQSYFVEVDEDQKIYILAQTEGQILPSPGVYNNPNSGQFIARYSNDLTSRDWVTTFGKGDGDPELSPTAFLVDKCFNIYVSGWGGSTNFSSNNPDFDISGLPLTPDAYQSVTDGSDFYFIVLGPDAANLEYATYFGGDISQEHVDGGTSRFDKAGIIYQAVCAGCGSNDDFPTSPGAWSSTNNSTNCNIGVLKFEFQLSEVLALAETNSDTIGCAPLTVDFINNSTQNLQYSWDFGDGTASSDAAPSHTYTDAGKYRVELAVFDTATNCVISDTAYLNIEVFDSATADFTFSPNPVDMNEPVQFTNLSTGSSNFFWTFGDGATSTDKDPQHIYEEPGEYTICLLAQNSLDCSDSICKKIIIPIIGLPNAFSPNGDGNNDILYVRGLGISELRLRIYNRWGELIFETNDPAFGWDGTYKGQPQEQEVYVYYMDAILETGEVVQEKGNITLIR